MLPKFRHSMPFSRAKGGIAFFAHAVVPCRLVPNSIVGRCLGAVRRGLCRSQYHGRSAPLDLEERTVPLEQPTTHRRTVGHETLEGW